MPTQTVGKDPQRSERKIKQLISNSKIGFYLQVLIGNNVTDYLRKANNHMWFAWLLPWLFLALDKDNYFALLTQKVLEQEHGIIFRFSYPSLDRDDFIPSQTYCPQNDPITLAKPT